jgi:hypothetical protein
MGIIDIMDITVIGHRSNHGHFIRHIQYIIESTAIKAAKEITLISGIANNLMLQPLRLSCTTQTFKDLTDITVINYIIDARDISKIIHF